MYSCAFVSIRGENALVCFSGMRIGQDSMRLVAIKTQEQLDLQALHRVRELLGEAPNRCGEPDLRPVAGAWADPAQRPKSSRRGASGDPNCIERELCARQFLSNDPQALCVVLHLSTPFEVRREEPLILR
jgi:hypothetical protein